MARARFTWSSRDAQRIMSSPKVQTAVRKQAEKGRAALGGAFGRTARVEPARGWDGRPGYRIVVPPSQAIRNPLAAEFGTRRSRGASRLQSAINAAGRRGGRR
ncbi:hypothetical protein RR21198_4280 [Rhodococcus rhodochrous ATCC 21198]|uniref:hypothetical protein n=1 Tax=Rhodococcus aetherivorans TaxID=191292 RepID=UPI0003E24750|nr:hypothetical protein [Rhodococcus aetherivorans]ETT24880.1 hypothetical protein RR21198_4280 [Rhodococcus rhodochrous ATCC 21198]NGP29996.1 hypothetical protein [Rhodococcus aetherivorans]